MPRARSTHGVRARLRALYFGGSREERLERWAVMVVFGVSLAAFRVSMTAGVVALAASMAVAALLLRLDHTHRRDVIQRHPGRR